MAVIATALLITGGLIASMAASRLIDLALPGNEALLRKAMMKLKFKKDSAEAQFLKELTLEEVRKQAEHLRKTMQEDRTGTNMLMQSIMSQDTAFNRGTLAPTGQDAIHAAQDHTQQGGLRGNRQDVEGMRAALASLAQKVQPSKPHPEIPANLRLTGRPTHG